MAKGNGGKDAVLVMYEAIVEAREGLRRTDKALQHLGRHLLKMSAENRTRFAELEKRLAHVEAKVA